MLSSCGGQTAGEAVRPKDQTFAGAMGEQGGACREPDRSAEPLVVDWKPEQRGDLEVLMHDSVAVVSYSCKGFRLLKDCKVDGKYGFLGMTKKEQVVKLTNADEVKANLPLAGAGIAASLGAEMQRGTSLDVALVMIGKVKTTWGEVHEDELKGDCTGATHFVKGATVGAFVMETGAKGAAKTAAQLFSAGVASNSTSNKSVRNQDGELTDCAKAAPDSTKAPSQCQALVRLELRAILPKSAKTDAAPPSPEPKAEIAPVDTACPKGLVLAEGKCTDPTAASAYVCKPSDGKDCLEQCAKGNVGSCGAAGALLASGGGGLFKDEQKARELLGKACDGGEAKSCTHLGVLLIHGRGGPKDAAGASQHFDKACSDGDATACGMLGAAWLNGDGVPKDEAKAVSFLQRACEGGHDASCGTVGTMLLEGRGAAKDATKGLDFVRRACDGGLASSCVTLGELFDGSRRDVPPNSVLAKFAFERACFRGEARGCAGKGRVELGAGGSADAAKRAFELACNGQNTLGCAAKKVLFGGTQPIIVGADVMTMTRSCMGGSMRDCADAGTIHVAAGNRAIGEPMINRACMANDPLACAVKNHR